MALFDFYCKVCGHSETQRGLIGKPCPVCGAPMFLKPYRMMFSMNGPEVKKKDSEEKEAIEYFDEAGKEESAYQKEVHDNDEYWKREYYRNEIHHQIAEECKREAEDAV